MARPSLKTPETIAEIAERLSKGEPLAKICRDDHMPHVSTVHAWRAEDKHVDRLIARARDDGEEEIALEALLIMDAPPAMIDTQFGQRVDPGDVALRKAQAEVRLKLLAKWNPKKWGDRIDHTHGGTIDVAHTLTQARQRVHQQRAMLLSSTEPVGERLLADESDTPGEDGLTDLERQMIEDNDA